jgi:hypothetical protein
MGSTLSLPESRPLLTARTLNRLVIASSVGGVITLKTGGAAFMLGCSVSSGATETYITQGALPGGTNGNPIATAEQWIKEGKQAMKMTRFLATASAPRRCGCG